MALGKKYTFFWYDAVLGVQCRYEIWEDGFTGSVTALSKTGESSLKLFAEKRDTNTVGPGIYGTKVEIELSTRAGLRMRSFLTEDPQKYQLRYFRNDSLKFVGWAQPILSDEPVRPEPYTFTLTFTDGVADLTKFQLKKAGAIQSKAMLGPELLALCLLQTGLELPLVIVDYLYHDSLMDTIGGESPTTRGAWDEWKWETLRYFDGAEPWNVYRIIENLCKVRTGVLMQADGKWWFIRLPDYRINPVRAWQYDKDGKNGASFLWTHTRDIPYNVSVSEIGASPVFKGLASTAKNWKPSVRRVQYKINYGHFRNQLLGELFDGSLNYKYSVTSTGGDIQALDGPGALALKQFKFLLADSGDIDALPDTLPYSHNNIHFSDQSQFSPDPLWWPYPHNNIDFSGFAVKDEVDGRHVVIDSFVRFSEVAIKKNELVRVSVQVKNYDMKGGRILIVAYPFAGLPADLDDVTPAEKSVQSFNLRRFLDETGQWSKKPKAINIENTTTKEISGDEVEVSEEDPRTFTVTSVAPYQFGGVVKLYLMPGWALEEPQEDEEDRYVLYDEISLETSQYFKDKKITAHEVRVENTANKFGEIVSEEVEIGETLNGLNYAYPAEIDNNALGNSSGQWFEYASIGEGFRSQNEWAAYSLLRMRQRLQMMIDALMRGDDYGPHYRFRITGGGDDYTGKYFLALSRERDERMCETQATLGEWIYGPVETVVSRKASSSSESTPLGTGSSFENWYTSPSGGTGPDNRGGRIGVPDGGGGGGLPDSIGDTAPRGEDVTEIVNDEFFTHDSEIYYEFPDTDPDTGEDVLHYQKYNGYGVLNTDEAPSFRPIRRNWIVSENDLPAGIDLSTLFINVPESPYAYLWLNGVRWFRIDNISTATDAPAGVAGEAFIAQKTANAYGEQWMNLPASGRLFYRSRTPALSVSPWREIITSDSAVLTDLIDDVENLKTRLALTESNVTFIKGDIVNIGNEIVAINTDIDNINISLAAAADQDTTTALCKESIDCQSRPQFVEIYESGGVKYCRLASEYIHGVVYVSAPRGGEATITLQSVKIKGFSGLTPGEEYALRPTLNDIIAYSPELDDCLYIGFAVSDTELEFPHIVPRKKKKPATVIELWCDVTEPDDEKTPLELWCDADDTVVPPVTGDSLIIGELESANSPSSYTNTNLTASGKRPVIAFYARLNGVLVPFGSDLQYSIDGGVTWEACGKYANGKHIAEGNVSSLPLKINFSTSYTLVVRLSINPSVVSNLLNVTTGPEPVVEEEVDNDLRRYIVWNGASFDSIRRNGLWQVAYDHGVRVMAPFSAFHWSKYEQSEGSYNFEDLEYHIEACATTGYQFLLWGLPQHSRNDGIGGDQLWRRKAGGGWEQYYKAFRECSFLPSSSWERDRYGNIAGSKGWNFGNSSSFSFSDAYATGKYLQLTARIAHLIWTGSVTNGPASGKPYKDIVHAFGLLGGGFTETSFNLQYRVPDPQPGNPDKEREVAYEIIYSDASMQGFRIWLEFERYGNISALNTSWGSNFTNFSQINKNNISKPGEYTWGVGYDDNNTTKDIFAFQIFQHATFYAAVNNAIRYPSSVVPGLVDSTDLLTAAYITENHTYAEGVRYGVAPMKTMYEDFDIHFSSTTAGYNPSYYSNNVLWDYALRAAEFAGTFGGTRFGQERDGDPVEARIGYSKIYNVTKRYGYRYQAIALQNEPKEWFSTDGVPLMQDTDGVWRSRKDSLKYLYDTEFKNTEHPAAPTFAATLSFTEQQGFLNPYNPNGIKDSFKNTSNMDAAGVSQTLTKVQIVKDIHLISLEIEADSITFSPVTVGGGSSRQVDFWAKINGRRIISGFAFEWSINGSTWYGGGKYPDDKLTTPVPSAGFFTVGMNVALRIRLTGLTTQVSNIVNITIG